MNSVVNVGIASQRQLVWCTCFASLFKFQTRCDSTRAKAAATLAFERFGAGEPFSAVESVIRGELTWPSNPEHD